jgi:hypothetical protein
MAADPALHLNLPSIVAEPLFLVHEPPENYVKCTAEIAECTCPEY